jgi:hypothetical protein
METKITKLIPEPLTQDELASIKKEAIENFEDFEETKELVEEIRANHFVIDRK